MFPFLDTLLRRREDGSLDVLVYRKPMHTDRNLHFESHQSTHVKRGVVRCIHKGSEGSTRRTIVRRNLTTLLEFSSKMDTFQTLSATLWSHTYRKQQTQAAWMMDRRRRDH